MSDADGTLLDAPHARRRAAAETRSAAPADDLSFASALRSAEVGRAKQFVPILLGMLAVGVLFMFVAGGDPVAKAGVLAGIGASAIAISYLLVLTRRPVAFTELRLTAIYAVCMLGFHAGAYFWGVFSPVAAIGALGIFFLGVGRNPRTALFLYLLCVVPQAALAVCRGSIARRARSRSSSRRTSCACSRSAPPMPRCRTSRWSGCTGSTSRTCCASSGGSRSARRARSPRRSRVASMQRARRASCTAIKSRKSDASRRCWPAGKVLDFGVSKLVDQSGTLTTDRVAAKPWGAE
jgi:hypothetical protein